MKRNSITLRGAAARQMFEGLTGHRILRAVFDRKIVGTVAFLTDKFNEVLHHRERLATITNDPEAVVQDVCGHEFEVSRILYKDTEGRWDELKFTSGAGRHVFTGFAPISAEDKETFKEHLV